jgi:hypothetical protein
MSVLPVLFCVLAIGGLLAGFLLCLLGWEQIDRRRRWQGAMCIAGGWLLGAATLLLLRVSTTPQAWDWWI